MESSCANDSIILDSGPASAIDLALNNLVIFCLTLGIIGFLGNGAVLYIVATMPKMRTTVNKFVTNLAVTDLLFDVNILLRQLLHHVTGETTNIVICKLGTYICTVFVAASNFTLMAISIERCIAIKYPHVTISSNYYAVATGCILSFAAFGKIPYLFVSHLEADSTNKTRCVECWQSESLMEAESISVFIFDTTIPFVVIIACYILIWREILARKILGQQPNTARKRKHLGLAKMIFVLIVVYTLALQPFLILYELSMLSSDIRMKIKDNMAIFQFFTSLAMAHSCMNPIIYCFMNENFRKGFKKIYFRRITRNKDEREVRIRNKNVSVSNDIGTDNTIETNSQRHVSNVK